MTNFLFVYGFWMAESDKEAATVDLVKYWSASSSPEPQAQSFLPGLGFFSHMLSRLFYTAKVFVSILGLVNHAECRL